jgi:hypothetical protein
VERCRYSRRHLVITHWHCHHYVVCSHAEQSEPQGKTPTTTPMPTSDPLSNVCSDRTTALTGHVSVLRSVPHRSDPKHGQV